MGVEGWIKFQRNKEEYLNILASIGFFFLMCYIFIGIAIASDIFMSAIEKICGATKEVKIVNEEEGVIMITKKETQIWNETVANLTLMALGSSAPEILLSSIEISVGLGRHNPGDLGPGTIVGSAAFNLMIISAVCILSLSKNATSRIKLYKVFVVTSITSLLAYLWMVVVLVLVSPDVVDLWEALVTLFFFPLFVVISYWADQDFCINHRTRRNSVQSSIHGNPSQEGDVDGDGERDFYFGDKDADNLYDADGNYDKNALIHLYEKLQDLSADLKSAEIVSILAAKLIQGKQHNRTWYRNKTARALIGGGSMVPVLDEKLKEVVEVLGISDPKRARKSMIRGSLAVNPDIGKIKAIVEFQAATLAVSESIGEFQVTINRTGKEDVAFQVHVNSADGTAKKDKEYYEVSQVLSFEPYENEQTVSVNIIDNVQWNPDSNFYLRLSIRPEYALKATLGKMRVVEIIIEDDDKPGVLSFEKRGYVFKDSQKSAHVDVSRSDGTDGVVSVTWKIVPGPYCKLVSPFLTGELEFQHAEMKKFIEIPFSAHQGKVEGQDETFEVVLSDPTGGAKLGKNTRTTCAVSSDENFKLEINNAVSAALKLCEESEEDVTYKDQIMKAILVNGGDTANATCLDWFLHIFTFPLKFVCSLIPPPGICGGWLCFFTALLFIGLLTKLVGDTASAFGDALNLDPTITAMTFVALGTSLPDTFASQIAAKHDKTADNAIGNVTGSNSVNVFLGLGVPWTIGAVYYMIWEKGNDKVGFCVPAGSLYINVLVFSICAAVSVAILIFRRYSKACGNAELGGPNATKWISAVLMIILWTVYIAVSSVYAQKDRKEHIDYAKMIDINKKKPNMYSPCAIKVQKCRENKC